MNQFKTGSLLLMFLSLFSVNNALGQEYGINGTWIPVRQEIGGNTLPSDVFKSQKLIINDSTYTVIAESTDKGVVRHNGLKMDIYGREGVNAGKHFTAIYKLEAGVLTICYDLTGEKYPETFQTAGAPVLFLSVFKRFQEQ